MVVVSEIIERSSSSSTNDHDQYDVFLSFQGADTSKSFIAHLHKALLGANISTFLDDEEIETGEDLKPEMKNVIKASRASIIILSKNYANSSWCLDELVLILEQRMTSNHIIIPIFYHVEPTHVLKQQSTFGLSIAEHKKKMEAETNANKRSQLAQKIDRWIKALTEVADLKGLTFDVNDSFRREAEFIEEIVRYIYPRFHLPSRIRLPQLIGMDDSIEVVTSWLKDASSDTGDILTIIGMDGIGKTSLAKSVYSLHFHEFETSSYIEDIAMICTRKFNGLLDLQEQLYDDITKGSSTKVHDVSEYTCKIEKKLACKKAFLVLDEIDSLDQLDALLGNKGFHPGSKVIITTKDACLTNSCALFKTNVKPKHVTHELGGLCETESRQLLCDHAFMSNDPKAGYEEVSEKLVMYCGGHPLALKVLGKALRNKDVAYCEKKIERLKKENGSPVNSVLRMSFESLPSKDDKDLFKHIACFFVGVDRDVTETILKACDINTSVAFRNLIDRCLLSIGHNNKLVMHQLVQEMGRFVVCQESFEKPWNRSRLWCHDESLEVLKRKTGTENIRGLTLDTRLLKNEKLRKTFELETDALSKMDNLMLLQLNYVQISGSYEKFPKALRWLCMHGFPLKSIPSELPMENLVALDMSYSNIESFGSNPQHPQTRKKQSTGSCSKDKRLLGSLKILNLSFCEQLRSMCGFDELSALEQLIVANCISLVEVCESIEQCVELAYVDMSYCNKLKIFPRTIGMLKNVKTLCLTGCTLGESQIEISDIESSEMLKAIPSDLVFTKIHLPSSLVSLSLANSNLFNESFPMDLSRLSMLKELFLDNNPIVFLPGCVRSLPSLKLLSMKQCDQLTSVKHPPRTLAHLDLSMLDVFDKRSLDYVVFDPEMSPLRLSLEWKSFAASSFEIQGMIKIQPMGDVEDKVLCSLGWTLLDFLNQRHMTIGHTFRESEGSETQMYYEFGIFSTFYAGEEIPNWVSHRSKGRSISFTIPSMPNRIMQAKSYNLRGLNFCFVLSPLFQFQNSDLDGVRLPMIKISNITKNRTWMYHHYIHEVSVGGKCFIFLSHWMFGMNEMEVGDQVTINLTRSSKHVTKECGVSFVYDDGKTDDQEDALVYYKSWNHIISGDITRFELMAGQYSLSTSRFWYYEGDSDTYGFDDSDNNKEPWFRALSQRKSNVVGQAHEDEGNGIALGSGNGMEFVFGKTNSTMSLDGRFKENMERSEDISTIGVGNGSSNYPKEIIIPVTGGLLDHRDGGNTKDISLAKKHPEVVLDACDNHIEDATRNMTTGDEFNDETKYDDMDQASNLQWPDETLSGSGRPGPMILEKTYPDSIQNWEEVPLDDRIPPPLAFNEPLDDGMRDQLDDNVQLGSEAGMVGSSDAGGNGEEEKDNYEEDDEVDYKEFLEPISVFSHEDLPSLTVGIIHTGPSNLATNLGEVLFEVPRSPTNFEASNQLVDRGSSPSRQTYIPERTCTLSSEPSVWPFSLDSFDIPKSKKKKKLQKTAEDVIQELDQSLSEEDDGSLCFGHRHRRLLMDAEDILEFPAYAGNEAARGGEGCLESLFVTPPEDSCPEVVNVDKGKAVDATEGMSESNKRCSWGGDVAKDTFVPLSSATKDSSLLDSGNMIEFMSCVIPPGTGTGIETKLADYSSADFYSIFRIKAAEQVALMAEAANRGDCLAATELELVGLRGELDKHKALLVEQVQKMASVADDLVEMQTGYEESQNKMKAMEAERSLLVDRLSQAEVARAKAESQAEHAKALREDADQKVVLLEASNSELANRLEVFESEKKQLAERVVVLEAVDTERVGQLKVAGEGLAACRANLEWVLQEGMPRCFDKVLESEAFLRASRRLRKACTDYGIERGCRLMRDRYQITLPDAELPNYKPDRVGEVKEAYSSFAETDYVSAAGFAELSVDALHALCLSSDEESN